MAFFAVQPLVYLVAWIQLHVRDARYTLSNTILTMKSTATLLITVKFFVLSTRKICAMLPSSFFPFRYAAHNRESFRVFTFLHHKSQHCILSAFCSDTLLCRPFCIADQKKPLHIHHKNMHQDLFLCSFPAFL